MSVLYVQRKPALFDGVRKVAPPCFNNSTVWTIKRPLGEVSVVQGVLQGPTHLTFNHFNPKWQIWPKKCHQILTKQQKNVASSVQFNISDSSFLLEDIFNLTCTHSTGPSLTSVGRWTGSRLRVRTAWSLRVRTRLWAPRASKCSASTSPVWKHISSRCWVKKKKKL